MRGNRSADSIESIRKWISAAKTLAEDISANVACPTCADGKLHIRDVTARDIIERYIECPKCKDHNVMRIARK